MIAIDQGRGGGHAPLVSIHARPCVIKLDHHSDFRVDAWIPNMDDPTALLESQANSMMIR